MKKINCLIVDDEPIARDILVNYIAQIPQLVLAASCRNATDAYQALQQHEVDVIFLDIQMPVITGVDFMRTMRKPPLVVFTTAYSNYAVEGFELNSVDYLLKPITFERFSQAIQKINERLALQQFAPLNHDEPDYIFIKQDIRLVKVAYQNISYIKAERDFCSVFLQDDKRLLASMHLKILEDSLPSKYFMRIHRSFIVNLDKIQAIKGNTIELPHAEVPIGANYRENFIKRLNL